MEADIFWSLPQKKCLPLAFEFTPNSKDVSSDFLNPYLGYPNSPLIGRYNKGQYKISDTLAHLQFQCLYDNKDKSYKCGSKKINIPEHMMYNLRNIPEVIKHNKPQNMQKNPQVQDTHPLKFPVLDSLKFVFMITQGQLGNDFLNYLNHMYTLGMELFLDEKLKRSVYHLPIYAYLPQKSGLMTQQVERGLNLQNYRSQYMSLHLKYGAPAFSPNNMRLGVQGMKIVVSNPQPKKNKDSKKQGKKKYVQKEQFQNFMKQTKKQKYEQKKQQKSEQIMSLDWSQIQNQIKKQKQEIQKKKQMKSTQKAQLYTKQLQQNLSKQQSSQETKAQQKNKDKKQDQKQKVNEIQKQIHQLKIKQKGGPHKGFVHFYTSVLLQNDYRVYYHWHIQNQLSRQMVNQAFTSALSVEHFIQSVCAIFGQQDQLCKQIRNIFI